jgi:rare lipoprotein A (peptidoglycan hydrolase)
MKRSVFFILIVIACLAFTSDNNVMVCTATWYSTNGHPKVHREHSTAAFNAYPKGTFVIVTNLSNNKVDTVEVTDRHKENINHIDLSKDSFEKIANIRQGRIKVSVKKIN